MIPELGHFAIILAFIASVIEVALGFVGAARQEAAFMQAARRGAYISFLLIALGFAALMIAHVTDDFSVLNVAMNSHTQKPLIYKIAGTWASHEGSMLLWVLILALFGAALARLMPEMPLALRVRALAVQGLIGSGFLAFILFASNPFARVWPPPAEGSGLNPLLQDPGLTFHPPFLYLGYVGFSSVFALAAALLLTREAETEWIKWLKPFALVAWSALTFGIAMGSWWAYYELGWGGWWFWDPVENVALMPWLAGTALVHSLAATEKRGALMRWTVLLAIVTFGLSLLGTFLVRSGVLTSVHSFALDPARGIFMLALLACALGGALALYAWRAPSLPESTLFSPLSREGALLLNNLFLCSACATLLTGTLYPLLLAATGGGTVSVGPPYFEATVVPLLLPVLLLMTIGPLLSWKQGDLPKALAQLKAALAFACLALGGGFYLLGFKSVLGVAALALGVWLVLGTLSDARRLTHKRPQLSRLLAHAGLGVSILGMAGSAFGFQHTFFMQVHDRAEFAGYRLEFAALDPIQGPNYEAERSTFYLWHGDHFLAVMQPEQRFYPVQGVALANVAIRTNLIRDLYLALGSEEENADGTKIRTVRLQINPLVPWIWIGAVIMALGGLLGLPYGLRLGPAAQVSEPAIPGEAE